MQVTWHHPPRTTFRGDSKLARSIKQLLQLAQHKLDQSPTARLDAEVLMAHALESTRSFLYANPELELPGDRASQFKHLVKQRAHGKPVAYLIGSAEFWSLPMKVTPDVLIPRPETELLVEAALNVIPAEAGWRVADLGTGSGAIALAIASERKRLEIHATDISRPALRIAEDNARRLGLGHIHFHHGRWNEPLSGKFNLVISNPPYVDADDPHLKAGDLRFEPDQALTPGKDGTRALRDISELVYPCLVDGGRLMLEHGLDQGPATREILASAGFADVTTLKDLQDHDRVSIGVKN